jgi:hypothetical protein
MNKEKDEGGCGLMDMPTWIGAGDTLGIKESGEVLSVVRSHPGRRAVADHDALTAPNVPDPPAADAVMNAPTVK